ncbi:MAG: hypothetical protein ACTSXO_00195 [Candidatus Heimdallarchaeota archaeon]
MIKWKIKRELLTIIEHPSLNWKNKASLIQELFKTEEKAKELFLNLIKKHKKARIRKAAASILGYLQENPFLQELCLQLFIEEDWSVRYAIAQSLHSSNSDEIIQQIKENYNVRLKQVGSRGRDRLQLVLAETFGILGLKESLPLLLALLDELYNSVTIPLEVILQTLYALGEVGDKSTVKLLLKFSADNERNPKVIQDSANHAIDKIAKRLGYATKKDLLMTLNKGPI